MKKRPKMNKKAGSPPRLQLLAQVALTGLTNSPLEPEQRADFYEALSAILPAATGEAARYAATCIREGQRAQQDLVAAIHRQKRSFGNPMNLPLTAEFVRQYLERKGITSCAVASAMGVHPGHLQRVLNGERRGSTLLLQTALETAQSIPDQREQRDVIRLLDAATHLFFLKRGQFESPLCNTPLRDKNSEPSTETAKP